MKAKKAKNYSGQIPFDLDGNLMVYPKIISLWGDYDKTSNIFSYIYNDTDEKELKKQINLNDFELSYEPKMETKSWGDKRVYWSVWLEPVFKDNFCFKTILKFEGFSRGRSAARACFLDTKTNQKYEMFLTSFSDLLDSSKLENGQTEELNWTFCKCGANYGVCLAK